MSVLITGATGFVGRALCSRLAADGCHFVPASRAEGNLIWGRLHAVGSIDGLTSWKSALKDCSVVVHLAGRVHVMKDDAADPLALYREVNVQGTLNLARQAAAAGVRRFVFLSSLKVLGEASVLGQPFSAENDVCPIDPYGVSKLEAESALRLLASETGMEIVIIRPPLVYGPGVRANFDLLMRAVARGIPLPLGSIENQRSLVALDNLVDLILICLTHPRAANQIFMVSDGEDLSTPDLVRRMAKAMDAPVRLVRVPVLLLNVFAKLTGKSNAMQRLCENLQVDTSKTIAVLGWKPPISVDEGLRRAVAQYRK